MGSVKRRPDAEGRPGAWLARWREPDGTQRKRAFARRKDAEAFLLTVESTTRDGTYVPPRAGRQTVGEYGAAWMARQVHWTPKSASSAGSLWRSRVEPRWGRTPLDAVRHEDVAQWVADMVAGGLSASRARQSYHLLTSILDAAVRGRLVPRNEAAGVELPRVARGRQRYLTHEELHRLADAAGRYRLLVLVLGYTGLRWGEATALRVRDLDGRRLLVQEAVTDVDGVLVVGEPKDHERRAVPVPGFLADELAEHARGLEPGALLFPAPRGGYLRNQNARRQWWDGAALAAGLPGLVPHELRHTAASLAIAAGADVLMVQRMLGHASATMTLDLYGHLWEDGLGAVADRLGEAAAPHIRSRAPRNGETGP